PVDAIVARPIGDQQRALVEQLHEARRIALGRTVDARPVGSREHEKRRRRDKRAADFGDVVGFLGGDVRQRRGINLREIVQGSNSVSIAAVFGIHFSSPFERDGRQQSSDCSIFIGKPILVNLGICSVESAKSQEITRSLRHLYATRGLLSRSIRDALHGSRNATKLAKNLWLARADVFSSHGTELGRPSSKVFLVYSLAHVWAFGLVNYAAERNRRLRKPLKHY